MTTSHRVKRLSARRSRFLNPSRRAVMSGLSFTDSSDVHYFDQVWLRKAMDIVEGRRGNVN